MKRRRSTLQVFVLVGVLALGACAGNRSVRESTAAAEAPLRGEFSGSVSDSRFVSVVGLGGMVVSDDEQASKWGAEILRQGGNAVDAAVATAFALSVTRPHYASLGGGGFFLFCRSKPEPCQIIDYRERAPLGAKTDMYVNSSGKADTKLSQDGALASGVPGAAAGLLMALEKFGTFPRQRLLKTPIELARRGIRVSTYTEFAANDRWEAMNPEARRIFGCGSERQACPAGTWLKQLDLARVLERISREGRKGFYEGQVARQLIAGLRASGGVFTDADLRSYEPRVRTPLTGRFSGLDIVTMPPPSSGGFLLLSMMGYAERADREGALSGGYGSVSTIHSLAHGMSLAFADRASFFGDPDFVKVPVTELLSSAYLDSRWKTFRKGHQALPTGAGTLSPVGGDGPHTTHFSVIDREGNAVAITTTINDNFGSAFVPPGTGIVMNNEMDDFSIQPGVPNMYGLIGGDANAVAPGKRPLSSMTPTIVRETDGKVRFVLGAAGGPMIPTGVFLSLLNRLRFGMSFTDSVAAARIHHQWSPKDLRVEPAFMIPEVRSGLEALGYEIKAAKGRGRIHGVERFSDGRVWGVPDPRGEGYAARE